MKKILLPVLFGLLPQLLFSQPAFVRDSLNRYVERGLKDWKIPGMAIAIIKDGKVVLAKGYGVREWGKPGKIDENTLFMIGSNTKAFTGTALSWLEYEKKLSLDDPVTRWLPGFHLFDSCTTQQVTLRDMLCHRVGLKTFQGDFVYWTSNLSRKEVLQKFGLNPPAYPFRTRYGYCNAGFLTAGEVIPAAAKVSWEEFVRQRIAGPLGMSRTLMLSGEIVKDKNAAAPHTWYRRKITRLPYPAIDNLAPAGSMSSSVKDLTQWLLVQTDSGRINGKEVIPFEVLQRTRLAQTIVSSQSSAQLPIHYNLYGLGWFLQDYAGRQVVMHTGGVDGFVTLTAFLPEEKLGIVVLANQDENDFYQALYYQILDSYLGRPYRNYHQLYLTASRRKLEANDQRIDALLKSGKRNAVPALVLRTFTGKYTHPVYGEMNVKLEGGNLALHFSHHPQLIGRLKPLEGNMFTCVYSIPTFGIHPVVFQVENGLVRSVTVKVNDFVEYDPYVFVRK